MTFQKDTPLTLGLICTSFKQKKMHIAINLCQVKCQVKSFVRKSDVMKLFHNGLDASSIHVWLILILT